MCKKENKNTITGINRVSGMYDYGDMLILIGKDNRREI